MRTLNDLAQLQVHQRGWAATRGFLPGERDYLTTVDDNLLFPLSAPARGQYNNGRGSELRDQPKYPSKMRALHSSSALVVNVFDYWTLIDKSLLSRALGIDPPATYLEFEYQPPLPTGTTPPNLDVRLIQSSGHGIAVESKFTEWTHHKGSSKSPFSERYFSGPNLWSNCGLDRCQKLAESLHKPDDDTALFTCLDAPQLLKHALGLANTLQERFDLWYVFYDFFDPQAKQHRDEIEQFKEAVGAELRFKVLTYQEVFAGLCREVPSQDADYLRRLNERYALG